MRFRYKIGMAISVFAVVAYLTAVILYTQNKPANTENDVVNDQLIALKADNIPEAYLLNAKDFQEDVPIGEFSRFVEIYPTLQNYVTKQVSSKDLNIQSGNERVVLTAKDNSSIAVEYDLVKENGWWRILHMSVKDIISPSEKIVSALAKPVPMLSHRYDNTNNRYTINYPSSWMYEKVSDGMLMLSGLIGTRSYYSMINIQTVLTTKTGGHFANVDQLLGDIKKQVLKTTLNVKFIENGPIEVKEKNGNEALGQYLIFTYTYEGVSYQQWQVVLMRSDKQVFYAWAYTAPIKQYPSDLPVAQAILASWQIY